MFKGSFALLKMTLSYHFFIMFYKLPSASIVGLDCLPVEVEIDLNKGQTAFNIVGLADTSIKEAKDRIHPEAWVSA